ncbi:dnaJ homolog subfamily C member 2-like [Branchiostoma lanceolatum]|uniref:dnaJ homolog subfamily C member 2-like n=1 Tax=Branchiostoma lanceolatum TaxID=7740 RepID=UPI00345144E9
MLPEAQEGEETMVVARLSAPATIRVEPVGKWFEAYAHRYRHKKTLSQHESVGSSSSSEEDEEDLRDEDFKEDPMLTSLDPKDVKTQDHYAVLGIAKLRYRATHAQIKQAYKRIVLKHHPDKRRQAGKPVKEGDDDYYSCITKAYQLLSNKVSRRSFDSVDPQFDDFVPPNNSNSKENFFEVFGPVISSNARWSVKKPVPKLGTMDSTYEEVDHFYSFWYDFYSWREFSYLDEEDKEKGEDREERRWIEKQNKAARQKRKKEEVSRILKLVDNAYACDPRIKKFKDDEKRKKEEEKKAKKDAARKIAEEKERQRQAELEAERKQKEKEEEEAKAKALIAKKEKEAAKKQLKKERKRLRDLCKTNDYYVEGESDTVTMMESIEKLCNKLEIASLQDLNTAMAKGGREEAKAVLDKQIEEMDADIRREEEERIAAERRKQQESVRAKEKGGSGKPWSPEDLALLVKAVKTFPAGTVSRWEVIANFINDHTGTDIKRTAKEVLNKTKTLQKTEDSRTLRTEVNKAAYERLEKSTTEAASIKKAEDAGISERFDDPSVYQFKTGPWSADEQRCLEQALRTYPAGTGDRWDLIAEAVPGRSKKDCMVRYKELVELVKAKKAAQAAAKK